MKLGKWEKRYIIQGRAEIGAMSEPMTLKRTVFLNGKRNICKGKEGREKNKKRTSKLLQNVGTCPLDYRT
jgi:hypothetical protein